MPLGSTSAGIPRLGIVQLLKSFCWLAVLRWDVLIWLLVLQKGRVTEYLLPWGVTSFHNCQRSINLNIVLQRAVDVLNNL